MTKVVTKRILQGLIVVILGLSVMAGKVFADRGQIYSCLIQRNYRHPVSGDIEDSGGENSFDIGQGMVEGTVYQNGMLESSDSGDLLLTFRMSLADFSGDYHFWVQPGGRGSFQAVAYSITQQGTDHNGATKDISISLPDVNCVIRGSMFVEPMGREVIFYLSPAGLEEGYSGNMITQLVTDRTEHQDQHTPATKEASENKPREEHKAITQAAKAPDKPLKLKSKAKAKGPFKLTGSKGASQVGLVTSLDKNQTKAPAQKTLPVIVYYLPTLILIVGGMVLWIWKKRKTNDQTI
ncbi:heme-binding protein [Streptococcus dysgalactiae subsp. dysgalactiae]|uniref:heme-binding Shp domain-containing protein n=1 Tax=Streptococcus dysgalactiae TaxID=1334 RepID=UPI001CF2E3B8|nr:heme-binding Shp domain-containing protein [Streptococcus dysgalactiae]MCB2838839.1 heme-binding protein [Streptococcus dysgalactiae subsp. dysgalactiae]